MQPQRRPNALRTLPAPAAERAQVSVIEEIRLVVLDPERRKQLCRLLRAVHPQYG